MVRRPSLLATWGCAGLARWLAFAGRQAASLLAGSDCPGSAIRGCLLSGATCSDPMGPPCREPEPRRRCPPRPEPVVPSHEAFPDAAASRGVPVPGLHGLARGALDSHPGKAAFRRWRPPGPGALDRPQCHSSAQGCDHPVARAFPVGLSLPIRRPARVPGAALGRRPTLALRRSVVGRCVAPS